MRNDWLLAVGCALSMSGCMAGCGTTNFTATGPKLSPREGYCNFQMMTVAPASGYAEIGVIDVQSTGLHHFNDLASFKRELQPYVCGAGGDAAIAYANGQGLYIKASVLKKVEGEAAPAVAEAAPAAADEGCKYDTQCKGDRICVQGVCAEPPAAAAPAAAPSSAAPVSP